MVFFCYDLRFHPGKLFVSNQKPKSIRFGPPLVKVYFVHLVVECDKILPSNPSWLGDNNKQWQTERSRYKIL